MVEHSWRKWSWWSGLDDDVGGGGIMEVWDNDDVF